MSGGRVPWPVPVLVLCCAILAQCCLLDLLLINICLLLVSFARSAIVPSPTVIFIGELNAYQFVLVPLSWHVPPLGRRRPVVSARYWFALVPRRRSWYYARQLPFPVSYCTLVTPCRCSSAASSPLAASRDGVGLSHCYCCWSPVEIRSVCLSIGQRKRSLAPFWLSTRYGSAVRFRDPLSSF